MARELLFGPLSPSSFTLNGHDNLPAAARFVAEDAKTFGAVPSPTLSREQFSQLEGLARARGDTAFTQFVARLAPARTLSAPHVRL